MGKFKDIVHKAVADGYDTEETMECLTLLVDEHLENTKAHDMIHYNKLMAKLHKMFDGEHMTHDMLVTANEHFENVDGTIGFKWDLKTTTQVAEGMGVHFNEYTKEDFNYIMNMLYSDFSKVLAKYGINRPSVYVELADAFLDDPDGPSDKAVRYFKAMGD